MKILAPGVEYDPNEKILMLTRCPKCGKENYALNVAKGICTWCGYDAHELLNQVTETSIEMVDQWEDKQ